MKRDFTNDFLETTLSNALTPVRRQGWRWLLAALVLGAALLLAPAVTSAVQAQAAPLRLHIAGPTYVVAGENLNYTLSVTNTSGQAVTGIRFYNDVPANTTYLSGGDLIVDDGAPYVNFTIDSLAANATRTVSWVARADSGLAVGAIITNDSFNFFDPDLGVAQFPDAITKVEARGTPVATYETSDGTPFDVTTHGYQFENYGNTSPVNDNDLDASDVFELFGPVACDNSNPDADDCHLTAPARQWLNNYALKASAGGHCDGLAVTSLRVFNSQPWNDYSTPGTFQNGAAVTNDLTLPSQPVENYIHRYFMTQDFVWNQHVTGTPTELLNTLTDGFTGASPVGYTASIFVTKNLTRFDDSDWKLGHSIAVYGVERVSNSESRILVYDNNFPNQRQYITVNTQNDTWEYSTAATPGEDEEVYRGTGVSGNLRLVPLSVRDLPAGQYFPCAFCHGETFPAAARQAAGALPPSEPPSGTVEVEFTGEGALMVVDDEGRRMGSDPHTGEFFREIPDGELEHHMGGIAEHVPPSMSLPFEDVDDTFYSVIVHGTTVDEPTAGSLSIHGPGFSIGVYDIALHPDAVFEFTFSPDGDHISFDASEDLEAPEIYIAHDPIHPGDPSVIFDLQGVVLVAGETASLDLDPELEQIHFGHDGPEAEDITIDMQVIYPDGEVEDHVQELHLPAGVHTGFVDFGAWDGLLEPPTYIGGVLQNPSVNHRLKLEDSVGSYDPTPQADAPAGVYSVEATFTNVTEVTFSDAYFTVDDLEAGNVVLGADGGPAGTGATISVPSEALGPDGVLDVNESFTFEFDIGLAAPGQSNLVVDANGVPHEWVHTDPAPSYDANDASFVFDVEAGDLLASCGAYFVVGLSDGSMVAPGFAGNLVVGTDRRDTLIGSRGADLIVGLDGNDRILGWHGDDVVCGNDGRDQISGGGGDDVVHGGAARDVLWGGSGHDSLHGDEDRDFIAGGNGDDTLEGGAGNDLLLGNRGDDGLDGGADRDRCFGGQGADTSRSCEVAR